MKELYANVALPVALRQTFTYSVPPDLQNSISLGARIVAPLGRKLLTGYVVEISHRRPDGDFKIRALKAVLDTPSIISPSLVKIALWISDYYFTYPGEVFRALLPAGSDSSGRYQITLSEHTSKLLAGGLRPDVLGKQENMILDLLLQNGALSSEDLAVKSGLKDAMKWIESLSNRNCIQKQFIVEEAKVGPKERLGIRRLEPNDDALGQLTKQQRELLEKLSIGAEPVVLQEFLAKSAMGVGVAKNLVRKGLVEIAPLSVERVPEDILPSTPEAAPQLTELQQKVFDQLSLQLTKGQPVKCLLHGVTGSGKTEIYLQLIAKLISQNASAIFLVPEIGLTPLLSRTVVARFPEQVALLHSGMSAGERFDQWNRIRSGKARVVVGTRSAVFAPVENLRLIILDEEQDSSYKQDESPCYHAREVAWQRIRQGGEGILLLGSATPSLESYYGAVHSAEGVYLKLPTRIEARPMPDVTIVDMTQEFQQKGKRNIIAEALHKELETQLKRGEQSIILLNRRGYARTMLCRSCGHAVQCSDCSVSMTYHQKEALLVCHYCGREQKTPPNCPNCGGSYIYFLGVGTEQLEEVIHNLFPHARIARVDRDTTRRKGSMRAMLLNFMKGRLDILIGTQMLAKGHDFPNVTLVGVVGADAGLSFPDFRSAERTFQLLTQVAGRAGRGAISGRVIIQAFYPEHYALRFAQKQEYDAFFNHEIEFRKHMAYPPFSSLIQIVITDDDFSKASSVAERVAIALRLKNHKHASESRFHILGPALAPIEKLRGQYRFQILIKVTAGSNPSQLLQDSFDYLNKQKNSLSKVHVDVDPLSLV